ncbi:hypothetical protein F5883DRAFT_565138 [Diaporthe sp. PMI_573]|nr:hypothetical protein F5883DRAFT_565138 [Diaporthaceae sp. PMI_573]
MSLPEQEKPSLGSWFLGRGLEIAFCSRPMWPAAQIQAPAARSGSLLSCICTCSLTPARDRRDHRGLPEGRRRNTKKQHRILRGISEQGRTERSGHPSSKPQRNAACTFVPRKCSTFWEPGLSTYQSPIEHTDIKPWPYHVIAVESGLPASPPAFLPNFVKFLSPGACTNLGLRGSAVHLARHPRGSSLDVPGHSCRACWVIHSVILFFFLCLTLLPSFAHTCS